MTTVLTPSSAHEHVDLLLAELIEARDFIRVEIGHQPTVEHLDSVIATAAVRTGREAGTVYRASWAPGPGELLEGVRALFNGDLHLTDPSYAPREDWTVTRTAGHQALIAEVAEWKEMARATKEKLRVTRRSLKSEILAGRHAMEQLAEADSEAERVAREITRSVNRGNHW